MNISILKTTLFCVALVLSLFSDKLFKQQYVGIQEFVRPVFFFSAKMYIDQINDKLIKLICNFKTR